MEKKPSLDIFTDEEIFHEAARRMRAKQTHLPKPKKLSPCPKCGDLYGVTDLRAHKPRCKGIPTSNS
jgi:hypothetical protein